MLKIVIELEKFYNKRAEPNKAGWAIAKAGWAMATDWIKAGWAMATVSVYETNWAAGAMTAEAANKFEPSNKAILIEFFFSLRVWKL